MAPTFVGGKLNLKGDKKKRAKKKSRKSKHREGDDARKIREEERVDGSSPDVDSDEGEMTEAERRSMKYKREREQKDLEKVANMSHRERIETFNEKLGKLTEHNDIPRVSAAGNG